MHYLAFYYLYSDHGPTSNHVTNLMLISKIDCSSLKATVKRATENLQLVLPENELNSVLRVLPPSFLPFFQQKRIQIVVVFFACMVKRKTSLFNSFCTNVAKQVARFCCLFYRTFISIRFRQLNM